MLSLFGIAKNFGGLQVLDDITLEIPDRGIFGLIGPNGAGKTTLFNLISGLFTPSRGTIEFNGCAINGMAPHKITRRGVARTFQNIRIFREMSLTENVLVALSEKPNGRMPGLLAALSRGLKAEAIERAAALELLARVGLADKAQHIAGTLSYGEQRRLEIARALATQPKLLLLDEPAAGMNLGEKQLLMQEIMALERSGLSLLIIEHDMRFIMGVCRQIAVLNFGRLIAQGTPEEIRSNEAVIEAYLGSDGENEG